MDHWNARRTFEWRLISLQADGQSSWSIRVTVLDIISGVLSVIIPVICPGARNADLLGELMNSDLFSILITIPLAEIWKCANFMRVCRVRCQTEVLQSLKG